MVRHSSPALSDWAGPFVPPITTIRELCQRHHFLASPSLTDVPEKKSAVTGTMPVSLAANLAKAAGRRSAPYSSVQCKVNFGGKLSLGECISRVSRPLAAPSEGSSAPRRMGRSRRTAAAHYDDSRIRGRWLGFRVSALYDVAGDETALKKENCVSRGMWESCNYELYCCLENVWLACVAIELEIQHFRAG